MEIKLTPDQEPIRTLNDVDKIYFATAYRMVDNIPYVYSLVSNRQPNSMYYDLIPHTEINVFATTAAANYFYGAINQIMEHQSKTTMHQKFKSCITQYIDDFKQKTK